MKERGTVMTDNRIEEYLAEAIEKTTPDILDSLMDELGLEETNGPALKEKLAEEAGGFTEVRPGTRRRKWVRTAMSLAASLVLVIGGIAVFQNNSRDFAVVGLDVNPSIELTISRNEKVKEARAVNEEGVDILDGMDLKGTDINTACNALVGSMLTKGYLSDSSNSVLLSVRANDAAKGKTIERELAGSLNSYLGESNISPAIMGQYVEDDDALEKFAAANNISVGKAWLIRNLLATGSTKMTEESLLKLSTQELILLGQERIESDDAVIYGKADTSHYIGQDKAIEIAVAAAGIDRSQASRLSAEYDADNGVIVYEVDFVYGGIEYEYDVDASTGKILKSESERDDGDNDDDDIYDDDDRYDRDDDDDDRYDRDDDDDDDRYDRDDDDDDD